MAFRPTTESGALPRFTLPVVKVTVPDGRAVPLAAFTVTVNFVVALSIKAVEPAERVVVVATRGGVTVTVTEPAEPVKFPVGTKVAVMLFAPDARVDPLMVSDPVETLPVDDAAEIVPREVVPNVKTTVPKGADEPEATFKVAVICVLPVGVILAGAAVTTVVVETDGADSVMTAVPDDDAKPLAPLYVATMELDPVCRLLPATVRFADAAALELVSVAVPNTAPPRANEMLPEGGELAMADFTATLSDVVPPDAIVAGLAVTVRVVETAGAATVTVTGDEVEDVNPADPP
jgi:hypothetical protein